MENKPFENYQPHLFPRLEAIAGAVGRVIRLGTTTELCLTEHKRGAAEMLDQHLDAPQLPFPVDRSRN